MTKKIIAYKGFDKHDGVAEHRHSGFLACTDCAQIGYSAKIGVSGEKSVVASAGYRTRVKAKAGTWVSLAEFNDEGECIGFATGCVGKTKVRGKVIPAGVWLVAEGGKLVPEAS